MYDVSRRLFDSIKDEIEVIEHYLDKGITVVFRDLTSDKIYRVNLTCVEPIEKEGV